LVARDRGLPAREVASLTARDRVRSLLRGLSEREGRPGSAIVLEALRMYERAVDGRAAAVRRLGE
jgi:hypothetical protein